MNPLDLFKPEWMELGLEDHPSNPTHPPTLRTSLPPVPLPDPSFVWLPELHPKLEEEMAGYRPSQSAREKYRRRRQVILLETRRAGIALPESFLTLTDSFELQDRIPSCSACYFDLPDHLVRSPFRDRDHILRFLNDQQDCFCWYMYIPHDADMFVISSSGDGQEPYLDGIDFAGNPESISAARAATFLVANSFHEFVYRFWISNIIWLHLQFKLPLPSVALDYIRHMDPTYADPNPA